MKKIIAILAALALYLDCDLRWLRKKSGQYWQARKV